jgi:hypothetical protein
MTSGRGVSPRGHPGGDRQQLPDGAAAMENVIRLVESDSEGA